MSQYLENMKIGDTIEFRGPNGLLVYQGRGDAEWLPLRALITRLLLGHLMSRGVQGPTTRG